MPIAYFPEDSQLRFSGLQLSPSGYRSTSFYADPTDNHVYHEDQMTAIYTFRVYQDGGINTTSTLVSKENFDKLLRAGVIKRCDDCGNVSTKVRDGLCPYCRARVWGTCQHCHTEFRKIRHHDSHCPSCVAALGLVNCTFCGSQGTHRHLDGDWMCDYHMRNNDRAKGGFIRYHSIANGKIIKHQRLVGTEIELESGEITNHDGLPKGMGIAYDGSLSDGGREFITPPASADKLEQIIGDVCAFTKKSGFKSSGRCGLHIHIDGRDFRKDPFVIYKLIKTYQYAELLLLSVLHESRRDNHYCDRVRRIFNPEELFPTMKYAQFTDMFYDGNASERSKNKYDDNRYCGLNIHSLFYRGSVEIRYHHGTDKPEEILNWTQLNLSLIEWAMFNFDEEKLVRLGRSRSENIFHKFCRLIKTTKANEAFYTPKVDKSWLRVNKGEYFRQPVSARRISHRGAEEVRTYTDVPF